LHQLSPSSAYIVCPSVGSRQHTTLKQKTLEDVLSPYDLNKWAYTLI